MNNYWLARRGRVITGHHLDENFDWQIIYRVARRNQGKWEFLSPLGWTYSNYYFWRNFEEAQAALEEALA